MIILASTYCKPNSAELTTVILVVAAVAQGVAGACFAKIIMQNLIEFKNSWFCLIDTDTALATQFVLLFKIDFPLKFTLAL